MKITYDKDFWKPCPFGEMVGRSVKQVGAYACTKCQYCDKYNRKNGEVRCLWDMQAYVLNITRKEESKGIIYLAGRMVGFEYFNFPMFYHKELELAKKGWEVINPARLDLEACMENPFNFPQDYDWNKVPDGVNMLDIIDRDYYAIQRCTHIYMFAGWEGGTGAPAEHALARWMGKEILYEEQDGKE